jgi:3-dehydroquinate synthetase
MKRTTVTVNGKQYPVLVGIDLAGQVTRLLQHHVGAARVFVFYDANFYALHGVRFARNLTFPQGRKFEFVVPSGEKWKSASVLTGLYDFLFEQKVSRDDFVLACGGGVTSDLVGYAAATALRGIRWAVVPTTLVGMVDAAHGGKTGINHTRGKNLIGAFWQPSFVCSNVAYLATLPTRHMVAGLGEALKTAGLSGPKAVAKLREYLDSGELYEMGGLVSLVHMCAAYKGSIVQRDARESGLRMVLNFGHTFAHGVEQALGFGRLLHGEAVVIGIDAALALGKRQGYKTKALETYRELTTVLIRRLPRRKLDPDAVLSAMTLDKKRSAADQRYVMLKQIGRPVIQDGIGPAVVRAALHEAIVRYQEYGGKDAHDSAG